MMSTFHTRLTIGPIQLFISFFWLASCTSSLRRTIEAFKWIRFFTRPASNFGLRQSEIMKQDCRYCNHCSNFWVCQLFKDWWYIVVVIFSKSKQSIGTYHTHASWCRSKMDKFDHWNLIYFLLQQQQNAPTHSCLTELHVHRCLFSLIVKFFH